MEGRALGRSQAQSGSPPRRKMSARKINIFIWLLDLHWQQIMQNILCVLDKMKVVVSKIFKTGKNGEHDCVNQKVDKSG